MKITCLTLAILFICSNSCADSLNLKLGVADYLVEGLDASPRAEISYELNRKFRVPIIKPISLGLELGIGMTSSLAHDTQVETPYTGKAMGRLNLMDYFLTLKWYPFKKLHIGAGVDYLDPYFIEYYSAQADWDDEVGLHAQVGWEFMEDWTVINKWGWGDIDVESGQDPQWAYGYKFTNGILEAQSNQHYCAVMIERKW